MLVSLNMATDKTDKNAKDKEKSRTGDNDKGPKTRVNPVLDKILAESTAMLQNLSKSAGTVAAG